MLQLFSKKGSSSCVKPPGLGPRSGAVPPLGPCVCVRVPEEVMYFNAVFEAGCVEHIKSGSGTLLER